MGKESKKIKLQFYVKCGMIISDVTYWFNLVASVGTDSIKWRLPGGTYGKYWNQKDD